jgi:hypothetical protein
VATRQKGGKVKNPFAKTNAKQLAGHLAILDIAITQTLHRLHQIEHPGEPFDTDKMADIWEAGAKPAELARSVSHLLGLAGEMLVTLESASVQRQWVGLTDDEMYLHCPNWLSKDQCKAWIQQIEAKLKEKNT